MSDSWTLRIGADMMRDLEAHLFPGDDDEHGAVIDASVVTSDRGTCLLARRLHVAGDGREYIAGSRGYRMLTASFVRERALNCAEQGLAYLAVHCHGGDDRVGFSSDDLASHARGYAALLDIVDGPPVGALVFARNAVAGDIWLPDGSRETLDWAEIVDRPLRILSPQPATRPYHVDERYDRQARLFGDRGQEILSQQKVAVVGAGGAGSLVIEYLARLGVGSLVAIDPDRIEPSNMSRVVGARRRDLRPLLTHPLMPRRVREYGEQHRSHKVSIAGRVARDAQPGITYMDMSLDVTAPPAANELLDCDYVFLAADSMQARLLVNAVVHQYLIPGVQVGAKVQVDPATGEVLDVFSAVRPLVPGQTCLWCNGLISPTRLQDEAMSPEQRRRQRYVTEADVVEPSVITLNAVAAAHAVNDYLLAVTGLLRPTPLYWTKFFPRDIRVTCEIPRRDPDCGECSAAGRFAAGPRKALPTRQLPSNPSI